MRIRKLEIIHFRSIQRLVWCPSEGLNCIIGPGDSGKSTILDAIDYCLGARRSIQFTDADFYNLDIDTPISITATLGDLSDEMKSFDTYGIYLRGFDLENGHTEDEPEKELDTVLTLNLRVESDLEPIWSLYSDRASTQNASRNLSWKDRVSIAPARIGALASYNLGWRQGSVLNKLTDEKADSSAALAVAARQAREAFGVNAESQLKVTLGLVNEAAKELGVDIGDNARALLDAHSVNFNGGTISLHNDDGVPLRSLGVGSTRLLIAGLQRKASEKSPVLLVDEVEYGLEPHRIIRFLNSLGSKESNKPFQVFMTTHSPVVLRELSGDQLLVLRDTGEQHIVSQVGTSSDIQGTIRAFPDAFLATSVLVCEGASEVGLVRGLDLYWQTKAGASIFASGTSLVDANGVKNIVTRALAFQKLGYRVAIFRDDDEQPPLTEEEVFKSEGGSVFKWQEGEKLESELFLGLPDSAVARLVDKAMDIHGEGLVDEHVKSASGNVISLYDIPEFEHENTGTITKIQRKTLAKASSGKACPWFKNITAMEMLGRDIVGPSLDKSQEDFKRIIIKIMKWASNA